MQCVRHESAGPQDSPRDARVSRQATAVKTWDASNIVWQNIYPDGTKWSVLEGAWFSLND
jgi:hypothetical protein